MFLRSFIFCLFVVPALSIVGYDCGQKFTNFTTYSLVDIGDCQIPEPVIKSSNVSVALIQLNDFSTVKVQYCKVIIRRTVNYCGRWSHISAVRNGEMEYIKEISREDCLSMHQHKSMKIYDAIINGLEMNTTLAFPLVFAGTIQPDGSCDPAATFVDPYGQYSKVIVQGFVSVQLEERYATVSLSSNLINLSSGQAYPFLQEHCIDSLFGQAFWDSTPIGDCRPEKYTLLHSSVAQKIEESDSARPPVYLVESNEVSFAFKDMGVFSTCGVNLIKTEHPKLFLLVDPHLNSFPASHRPDPKNLDIFTYVNSKFVYVEQHVKGQLNNLYKNILFQQCELEKKTISNSLSLATISPDLLAYQLMQGPGYNSLLAGEVVHILKCVPVEVSTRKTEECYQELPVSIGNRSMFLAPRTHILREYGTKTVCDDLIPVMYSFGNQWIKVLPGITTQENPNILKPSTKPTWNYRNPVNLANTGVYTTQDLDKLRTYTMFPNERNAVLNQVALGVSGKVKVYDRLSIANMLTEDALNKIAESSWNRIWSRFITFGSASAGLISIIMIFRLVKFVLDTIIHGYALHSIYGWSIHILASLWNSLTQLIIHLARKPETEANKTPLEITKPITAEGTAPAPPVESGGFLPDLKPVPAVGEAGGTIQKIYPSLGEPVFPALPSKGPYIGP